MLESHQGGYVIGDEHLVAGSGAFVGRPHPHRVRRHELPEAARPRVAAADSDSDDEPVVPANLDGGGEGAGAGGSEVGGAAVTLMQQQPCAAATGSDDGEVLRATRQHLPAQARMAGFEIMPGEGGRAGTIVQKTPGLMTPGERRHMLAVEVAHAKAERLRKSMVSQRARRAMLIARRHPAGTLGVGGVESGSAATPTVASAPPASGAYDKRHVVLDGRRAALRQRTAARRAALMRVASSVARRGYDLIAPDRPLGGHPEAEQLRSSLQQGGLGEGSSDAASMGETLRRTAERGAAAMAASVAAARDTESLTGGATRLSRVNRPLAADGLAFMADTGDYRGAVVQAATAEQRVATHAAEGGLKISQHLGRSMPAWMRQETSGQRLFPQPEPSPGRWADRAKAQVDRSTRGRDFDIVTGKQLQACLAPTAPGKGYHSPRELREAHPSLIAGKSFVDR